MRRVIAFLCAGETLVGSVDVADGPTGVLIVSGGNEVRAGAHRGMAALAWSLARDGIPTFRFDRRGIGDSEGENRGWAASGPDIAAAAAAFRAVQPQVRRVVGFGNCDGATALALAGAAAGIDALVLGNPWVGDDSPLPPPGAIRARYAAKLRDPGAIAGLLTGRVDLRKFVRGLRGIVAARSELPLAAMVGASSATLPTTILLAHGDRTAQQFARALPSLPVIRVATSSHSFADAGDAVRSAILEQVAAVQRRESAA